MQRLNIFSLVFALFAKYDYIFESDIAKLAVYVEVFDGYDRSCVLPICDLRVRPTYHGAGEFASGDMIVHLKSASRAFCSALAVSLAVFLTSAIRANVFDKFNVMSSQILEVFSRLNPINSSSAKLFHTFAPKVL